jgi:hypothetical protein
MTPRQLQILQHSLGCDQYGRNDHPEVRIPNPPYYRNHFCAGGKDEEVCRELVALGYMAQHETTQWLPYFNCSATKAGIAAMKAESPAPPKLTRSQKRYREFLDASDAFGCTFREFLTLQTTDWYKNLKNGVCA